MSIFYVVGGRQKPAAEQKEEWFRFEQALVLRVDMRSGAVETVLEYVSPPEARPDGEYSCLFKAGTVEGDTIHLCTQTEIITYSLPEFRQLNYISLPCLNDVHHVKPTERGTLFVANTGLDMVLELSTEGEILREWGALGQDPWQRFSRDVDYRKVPTTKPHEAHPNFVIENDDEVWCTRFVQKDAVCLTNPQKVIAIEVEKPHDGILKDDQAFFTTVNGNVVIADLETAQVRRIANLNELSGQDVPLGWCRGISFAGGSKVAVGFSRLRPTVIKQNIRWVKFQLGLSTPRLLPTRISLFDLENNSLLQEVNLEQHGMAAIFSIHPAPEAARQ